MSGAFCCARVAVLYREPSHRKVLPPGRTARSLASQPRVVEEAIKDAADGFDTL
jgi:hypothetical protein